MTSRRKFDCRHLQGYKPCRFHKETKMSCTACVNYEPISFRILILKTGAAGEVIRNTPLLYKLRQLYPRAEITWVTYFPELVPRSLVDRIIKFSWESSLFLAEEKFDLLLSLDKENHVCALANKIKADTKKGFYFSDAGKILPFDSDSMHKWRTGIDDNDMIRNTKHYVQEIYEICGYAWEGEKYILPDFKKTKIVEFNKTVVGVNTGAGALWLTRIPHMDKLNEIIEKLIGREYDVVLLGGPDEDQKNKYLSDKYKVSYFGVRSFGEFINIVDNCEVVITPVTMALHIAIGLSKHVVLLNNIFNKNEFHLYGKGKIIEPAVNCIGCYKKEYDGNCPVSDCTRLYDVEEIMSYLQSVRK